MQKFSILMVSAALFSMSGAAGAASAAAARPNTVPKTAYEKCLAAPEGQTTYGMIACISAETQVQDARLNRAYQAAIGRLERPRQKAALQKAQRAWIAFRDADCASYMDEDWGSMAGIEASQCVLDHTAGRANELEAYRAAY